MTPTIHLIRIHGIEMYRATLQGPHGIVASTQRYSETAARQWLANAVRKYAA